MGDVFKILYTIQPFCWLPTASSAIKNYIKVILDDIDESPFLSTVDCKDLAHK